jgi:membrane-associated protease RseP (regulator of RpoE activity)
VDEETFYMTATIEEIRAYESLKKEKEQKQSQAPETQVQNQVQNQSHKKPAKATKMQQSRILSAGIMGNFCVAFIAFLLFFGVFLGGIQPIGSLQIADIDESSPAYASLYASGLTKEMIIVGINGQKVTDIASLNLAFETIAPGDAVEIQASYNRVLKNYTVQTNPAAGNENYAGILVENVVAGSPAEAAGIKAGMIIYQIDGEEILNTQEFSQSLSSKKPADTIVYTVKSFDEKGQVMIEEITAVLGKAPSDESRAYLGIYFSQAPLHVGLLGISVLEFNSAAYLEFLKSLPSLLFTFDSSAPVASVLTMLAGWLFLMMLPLLGFAGGGFSGFSGAVMQFFEPVGWAEPLGIGVFWIANLLFWIGWINFSVGLFNCLPALPFDGGHLFRIYLTKIAELFKVESKKASRFAMKTSVYVSLFIFLSFMFIFTWPYINGFFFFFLR